MSATTDSGKTYHNECTGLALETVNKHQQPADITLFGSWFCPFVQRVWIAFEHLGVPYKYLEVDPYKKPKQLLEVSPKGLVPGLKLNSYDPPRSLNESTVILDYLEDLATTTTNGRSLFPPKSNPYARALVRLQSDHISRSIVPAFYRYLQAQESPAQIEAGLEFHSAIESLIHLFERAERENEETALGLWKEGRELGWADIMAVPWLFRASNVLKHYRGFELPPTPKVKAWLDRLFDHPAFRATCSSEELYFDAYERRYAYNRPNTSQVANAINSRKELP
jgi:glutathione S-transferase